MEETKEEFCGACIAGAVALAGAGAAGAGMSSKGAHQQTKKILIISGIATVVVAIVIAIYFLASNCSDCK